MRLPRVFATAVVTTAIVCALPVHAQRPSAEEPGEPTKSRPGLLNKIHIDQQLDTQIPLDLPFTDESGRQVKIGDYFGKRPVILALVYYECPMLCTQVLNGLVTALTVMNFEPGREFEVVAVSFNPAEGPGLASQKKAAYMERYGRPQTAAGWHFLTGPQQSIKQLTEAVGFHYEYDDAIKQFAHGAAIEVLTPKGHISKYFYGIEYSARDIRLGLIEASEERIGTPIDDFLLFCYHYDPTTGKYGAAIIRLVRLGGVATVLAFLTFLAISLRRERQITVTQSAVHGTGPSGGAFLPPDGGAQSAPARERPAFAPKALRRVRRSLGVGGAWGPRERPSRGPGRSPDK